MPKYTIDEIFKSTETKHSLSLFDKKLISSIALYDKNGKPYLKCFGSDKERPAKPEEIVRQLFIKKLLDNYGYPKERIQVEKDVWFGSGVFDKRADIVVLQKDLEHPFIIIEVKKPSRKDGIEQLKSYCNAEGSPIGIWTNGSELVILHREEPNVFTNISDIPTVDQSLQDVIAELWTLEKLTRENKLIKERVSLKSIILDLEDLVLANAGVDAFEEVLPEDMTDFLNSFYGSYEEELEESNGELMLDENRHLIVDHDLDFIAEKFIEFAKRQRFDFWKEGYRVMYSEMPLAAETETKYGER